MNPRVIKGGFRVGAVYARVLSGAKCVLESSNTAISLLRMENRRRAIAMHTIAMKPSPPITPPIIAGTLQRGEGLVLVSLLFSD